MGVFTALFVSCASVPRVSLCRVFPQPINDEKVAQAACDYLAERKIEFVYDDSTVGFLLANEKDALRIKTELIVEGVVPAAYAHSSSGFLADSGAVTDYEREARQRCSLIEQLKNELESLDWIKNAEVVFIADRVVGEARADVRLTIEGTIAIGQRMRNIQSLVAAEASFALRAENVVVVSKNGDILSF